MLPRGPARVSGRERATAGGIPMRTRLVLAALAILALALGSAAAASIKPKPWQWTTTKMNTRLIAAAPFVWSEVKLETASCAGQGKPVAGRFSRFQCKITFGDVNMSSPYRAELLAKVLPVGTGKLCIVAGPGREGREANRRLRRCRYRSRAGLPGLEHESASSKKGRAGLPERHALTNGRPARV